MHCSNNVTNRGEYSLFVFVFHPYCVHKYDLNYTVVLFAHIHSSQIRK